MINLQYKCWLIEISTSNVQVIYKEILIIVNEITNFIFRCVYTIHINYFFAILLRMK
jgi:hypothetical protein